MRPFGEAIYFVLLGFISDFLLAAGSVIIITAPLDDFLFVKILLINAVGLRLLCSTILL